MSATENQGLISGGQMGAGVEVGQDPGSIRHGAVPAELGGGVARAAAPRDFQAAVQALWEEEEGGQEAAQPVVQRNWDIQPVEEEEEEEEEIEEEEEEEDEEDDEDEEEEKEEDDDEKEGEGKGGDQEGGEEEEENEEDEEEEEDNEEEEDDNFEEENENYLNKEEEKKDYSEGRILDATIDFKLGYFFCHFLVTKKQLNISFFTKEATEYENFDEEAQEAGCEEKEVEEDESEEPEEKLEIDMESAGGNCVESSWKA